MSLSAGSSPLHSPKITPHTSPAPRRRSHTPNPANYMVPTSASASVANTVSQPPSTGQVIQKETVGGTTYFYTDTTPAPLTGMVRLLLWQKCMRFLNAEMVDTTEIIVNTLKPLFLLLTLIRIGLLAVVIFLQNNWNLRKGITDFFFICISHRFFYFYFSFISVESFVRFFTAIERKNFMYVLVDT